MIIVGHRGARNEAPENTVEGFVHAQQQGCQYFELDIQLSADHELVVFHDSSLKRTTGQRGKLGDFPLSYLQTLNASFSMPTWRTQCPIPCLQSVVNASSDTINWQFEIKTDSRYRLSILIHHLYDFIIKNGLIKRVTVTSSNRWFLKKMAFLHPNIATGYVAELPFINPVKIARKLKCKMLAIGVSIANKSNIKRANEAGLHVSCWTVNDLSKMRELEEMGVDSIITDVPSLAIQSFL
ncbi:MAG: glycerophosphoryl diester phosphodiesterase [Pseudohongiellaceae bacterium]|jgi:glycerophosphoryl diester phosphodiesterase